MTRGPHYDARTRAALAEIGKLLEARVITWETAMKLRAAVLRGERLVEMKGGGARVNHNQ